MKPFNLEEALAGEPVVTRDGRPVKIAGYNGEADNDCKVAFWIGRCVYSCTDSGIYNPSRNRESNFDLFMAATERKEWIVRIANPTDHRQSYIAGPFKTLEAAKDLFNTKRKGWASIHEITIIE